MADLAIYRLEPAEPLHKRVPSRDEHGRALTDFMVLLPGLRDKPNPALEELIGKMQLLFAHYGHAVRFAELNLRLNLLWVSVKPITRIRYEIASALQDIYPGARLVCHI
jgi:hypothetical protein